MIMRMAGAVYRCHKAIWYRNGGTDEPGEIEVHLVEAIKLSVTKWVTVTLVFLVAPRSIVMWLLDGQPHLKVTRNDRDASGSARASREPQEARVHRVRSPFYWDHKHYPGNQGTGTYRWLDTHRPMRMAWTRTDTHQCKNCLKDPEAAPVGRPEELHGHAPDPYARIRCMAYVPCGCIDLDRCATLHRQPIWATDVRVMECPEHQREGSDYCPKCETSQERIA